MKGREERREKEEKCKRNREKNRNWRIGVSLILWKPEPPSFISIKKIMEMYSSLYCRYKPHIR
jgi:hypothetical protein